MKHLFTFLLAASGAAAFGQARGGRDSEDIMDFLIQSQIVEFKPSLSRDPFTVPSDLNNPSRGLLIDEVTIKGRYVKGKTAYAVILDAYQQTLRIPIGYRFLDGEVVNITENAVVFNQWDPNSTNRAASRQVTRFFKSEED